LADGKLAENDNARLEKNKRGSLMTTNAAEKLAADAHKDDVHKDKDKEKVEKRRALGRGLESLLPGPRVVTAPAPKQVAQVLAPIVIQTMVESAAGPAEADLGRQTAAALHPIAEVPSKSPLLAKDARNGAPRSVADPEGNETITIFAQAESRMPGNLVVNLDIADIDKNPFQTRYVQDDGALEELADSIRANGVVQPIMVRPSEEQGRYILVLGERRLHASKKAGKTVIPALVRRVSLQQAAEMTIIENLQREDLSALEQAQAFRVLSNEFKMTQQQIGERVGLSRTSVTNYMRLLKLPPEVMQLLAEKKLSFAEAKELLTLENDDQISKAALYAVKKGLTLEQIERLVLSMNGDLDPFPGMPGQVVKKSGARWVDPNVRSAQLDLERMLGVRVRIRDRKGKGKIVIEYSNVDDYERVVGMLQGKK
jgi:ParB family chromosome partitioning protein